jgi:hypothetical protein
MDIHKSHSKTDLIDIINFCGIPVVFNHSDNKKSLQSKIIKVITSQPKFKLKDKNHYKLSTMEDVRYYLSRVNPKKTLTIKEKSEVMRIAKCIIYYATHGFDMKATAYKDTQSILDDMLYIKGFGDIPSVRRACRLMKNDCKFYGQSFEPMISPQVQRELDEKKIVKSTIFTNVSITHGEFILSFD